MGLRIVHQPDAQRLSDNAALRAAQQLLPRHLVPTWLRLRQEANGGVLKTSYRQIAEWTGLSDRQASRHVDDLSDKRPHLVTVVARPGKGKRCSPLVLEVHDPGERPPVISTVERNLPFRTSDTDDDIGVTTATRPPPQDVDSSATSSSMSSSVSDPGGGKGGVPSERARQDEDLLIDFSSKTKQKINPYPSATEGSSARAEGKSDTDDDIGVASGRPQQFTGDLGEALLDAASRKAEQRVADMPQERARAAKLAMHYNNAVPGLSDPAPKIIGRAVARGDIEHDLILKHIDAANAPKVRDPAKYFVSCVKNDFEARGIAWQ